MLLSTVLKECFTIFVISHGVLLEGSAFAFIAFLIPRLYEEGFQLDTFTESWIGSIVYIVAALTSIFCSFLFGIFGRIRNLQFGLTTFAIGYLILIFSHNVVFIYIGLGMNAVGIVFILPILVTYISETCDYKRREFLLYTDFIFESFGGFLNYLLSLFLSWRTIAVIWVATAILGLLQSFFIPETKYWHLRENRTDLAIKSILWFEPNLPSCEIDSQLQNMKNSIKFNSSTGFSAWIRFFSSLRKIKYFMPVFIAFVLYTTRGGAGRIVIISNAVTFFSALGTSYNSESLAALYGIADFLGSLICTYLTHKFKVKKSFYIISITAMLTLIVTIGYLFYKSINHDPAPYFPIIGTFIYGMMLAGMYNMIFVTTTEIQFAEFRCESISSLAFFTYGILFVYNKLFPYIRRAVHMQYILLYFLFNILISAAIMFFFVPDNNKKLFYETGNLQNIKVIKKGII